MDKGWTISGVSDEIREAVAAAATEAGVSVGAWVEQVLSKALAGHRKQPAIEEDASFVGFDRDALGEILRRMGISQQIDRLAKPSERDESHRQAIDELQLSLEGIKDLPINKAEIEPRILIGKRHFNLHQSIFAMLEIGANVLVVILTAPAAGPAAPIGLLPSIISISSRLGEIIKKLEPDELDVMQAIFKVIDHKQKSGAFGNDASSEEVKIYFDQNNLDPPPGIDDILQLLVDKKVLTYIVGADGKKYYRPVP
jgi:hypothetical protein